MFLLINSLNPLPVLTNHFLEISAVGLNQAKLMFVKVYLSMMPAVKQTSDAVFVEQFEVSVDDL